MCLCKEKCRKGDHQSTFENNENILFQMTTQAAENLSDNKYTLPRFSPSSWLGGKQNVVAMQRAIYYLSK